MADLPTTFNEPVLLGVIGGTGLYHLETLTPVARLTVSTPWGHPSSPITISRTKTGFPIAFLARHGVHHQFNPSEVPSRANIAALKSIGVKAIIAFSAVGSLQEPIRPRDFVLPTQIIDRTKGIRPSTFFEGGMVGHVGFGDPFNETLAKVIAKAAPVLTEKGVKLHTKETAGKDLTLICMEGPAFSTRAESHMYRSFGGSVINMSAIPEAKLAKEAEISYQMICMSTDYDAWREGEEAVTVETVVSHLKANSENAHNFTAAILDHLEPEILAGKVGTDLEGSMRFAVSTSPTQISRSMLEKMHFLLPGYWPLP
ncbi:nucleoside phosphorylase domain-containing protein [Lipomyces oligophaga]|uniref:nucleoside phosphorylase domain-containing protein n=1 Tax=Lipomyces oligophaga TaxID=45792 RepID=UPI0034CFA3BC